ncbi:MAG: alpha/beta fold hydrolase [Cyanobacteria bacterium P01_H01_bin.15]
MSAIDALWISVSPSFERFNRPLEGRLSSDCRLAVWEYVLGPDESTSLEGVVGMLQEYMAQQTEPIHLIGHGLSGLVGLLLARRYPSQVKSLTLLAVGCDPAHHWQTEYYQLLANLPCQGRNILNKLVAAIFGRQPLAKAHNLADILAEDLLKAPSPTSLWRQYTVYPRPLSSPLLVCGSVDDPIVSPGALQGWSAQFKASDRLWQCPGGRHFFHYFYPDATRSEIVKFWSALESNSEQSPEISNQLLSPVHSPKQAG